MDKYEQWIACMKCRNWHLVTEEWATYPCPYCHPKKDNVRGRMKPLDVALKKIDELLKRILK